jgi:hypothetical protein
MLRAKTGNRTEGYPARQSKLTALPASSSRYPMKTQCYSAATVGAAPAAGRRTKKHRGINNTLSHAEA